MVLPEKPTCRKFLTDNEKINMLEKSHIAIVLSLKYCMLIKYLEETTSSI